jgi:NitT/TauT family transport system ATP-binding protein
MYLLTQIHKRFGDAAPVLQDLHLEVKPGERVAFIGPSGCGKTTLVKICAGLEAPSSGQLKIKGKPVQHFGESGQLSYVFQEPNLLPWAKVKDNVLLPLKLQGSMDPKDMQSLLERTLAKVGLKGKGELYPDECSGGMKMRVSLARAMVTAPDLLLLDEPFGALDELTREDMGRELDLLCRDMSSTVMLITHDLEEAMYLCDRVLVMAADPGRIIHQEIMPWATMERVLELKSSPEFFEVKKKLSTILRSTAHGESVAP